MRKLLFILTVIFIFSSSAWAASLDSVRWKPKPGTVSLTFDDGPSPVFTPQVLKILKKYDIKATFFVMGWAAKKYPDLIKQMVAEGHAVASHTDSHKMLTKLSPARLKYEIVMPRDVIKNIIGKAPVCLRPPYGVGNQRVKSVIRRYGMIMVPMGFNSFDYKREGADKLQRWVVKNARAGRVVLLHDGYKSREQTVAALPAIIEGIKAKGLGFSAICYPQ